MLNLEELREIEPSLKDLPDKEVEEIRNLLHDLAQLALECYFEKKASQNESQISKVEISAAQLPLLP